jgi:hypothetical protein
MFNPIRNLPMTRGALLTIGTTPLNLVNLLRGITAGASRTYGTIMNDQCRRLSFQCQSGTIYVGLDSAVSATDHQFRLLNGETNVVMDSEANSLNASDYWLVGAAAGTKVAVEMTTL